MSVANSAPSLFAPSAVPFVAIKAHTLDATSAVQPPVTLGRVLHVVNGEHFSGAERVQQLLGKQLPWFGFEASIACVKPGKFPELCDLPSEQVFAARMQGRCDLRVVGQLARQVVERHIDVLHAHTPRTALVTALVSMRTGVPWVYHVHSPTARDSTRGFINRANHLLELVSIRGCQQLITVSRSLRHEMLSRGVPRSRLSVVPNGVPAIEPIVPGDRQDKPAWKLGLIALMRPRKGVEVALQAMHLIKQQQLPITLELIGGFETEDYRKHILDLIHSLRLQEHVQWSGFTNDIATAIRRLDAMVLPSLFGEGMPMVVLEALAAGVPVIATRVEGTPEVVRDGVEGLLAEPTCARSLADKIVQLCGDRHAWGAMSQRAVQRHRSHFSDQHMANRVARVYRRLLKR